MPATDLKAAYKTIMDDHFPPKMEISFIAEDDSRQTLCYEKGAWQIDGIEKGLRYGENPGQEAALYRLTNGNLTLGDVTAIQPGRYLASNVELLQSGKHPGKTNITDADNALNILRYLAETPCVVIVKHNNPCGVAKASTLAEAYHNANMADRLAAFGGAIALNRPCDVETATLIAQNYAEVVLAPEFEDGVMDIFAKKKNLRVMRIRTIERLQEFAVKRFVDFKSLIDGGLVAQWSFQPQIREPKALLPAVVEYKGQTYKVNRQPTAQEQDDMIFGWLVEAGVTSNSVLYVKNGATVGIGTGEQDRVGVAQIARDKAYTKLADRLCWEQYGTAFNLLKNENDRNIIEEAVKSQNGGLTGACMVSDAFFPFRDGIEVGLREGVSAVVQPGGSLRDYESIEACNEYNAAMCFTGQRSFKH